MTNDLKTLLLLEDKIWNSTPLQDDEYDTVFSILDQSLIKDVVVLAGLISVNHRPTLLRLIKGFPKYRAFKQQQLYIALGTANGPMRLGEVFLRVISAALTISIALGPPDPAIIPVRSLDT